jgi:hypothetical protein
LLARHLNESTSDAHLFKHSDRECVIILAEMCRARFGFLDARCPLTALQLLLGKSRANCGIFIWVHL